MPRASILLMAVLAYWLIVVAFQSARGAFSDPFGGYPDEPAHYMSGLLIRDYVAAGFPGSPLAFATRYYTHMPFLAIGYWPPLFYGIEGLWMTAFGWDRATVLLLSALIAAAVAGTCFRVLMPYLGLPGAFISGLLLLITPAFQWSECLIMTDTMLALLCLWFGLAFARWAERPSAPRAFLAGLMLAAALLTKINSIHLFAVPPLFFLVTNRWALLRRASLWIIPGTALTCWIPWILNTHQLLAIGFGGLAHRDALALLLNLGLALERNLAWLIVLVLVGTGYVWKRERHDYVLVVCVLLAFSYAAFLLAAGVDIEYRFLTPILTPSIILTGIGLGELAGKLASGRLSRDLLAPIMAMVCVIGFVGTVGFRWHVPATNTIDPVVEFLRKRDTPGRASVLVPTSAEGPFIAQFAMRDLQHLDRLLVRPVKLLASETWNGGSYLAKYSSQAEMIALFDRFPLRYIILAAGGPGHEYEHDVLLRATLEDHPERWTRIAMPSLNWVLYERSDGRELPAGEMEALAREALSPRLHDFE